MEVAAVFVEMDGTYPSTDGIHNLDSLFLTAIECFFKIGSSGENNRAWNLLRISADRNLTPRHISWIPRLMESTQALGGRYLDWNCLIITQRGQWIPRVLGGLKIETDIPTSSTRRNVHLTYYPKFYCLIHPCNHG